MSQSIKVIFNLVILLAFLAFLPTQAQGITGNSFSTGYYTNMCGYNPLDGSIDRTSCSGACNPSNTSLASPPAGSCSASGSDWGARFVCSDPTGTLMNCNLDPNMLTGFNQIFHVDNPSPGPDHVVQIDIFDHDCTATGTWNCGAPKDFLTWYCSASFGCLALPTPTPTTTTFGPTPTPTSTINPQALSLGITLASNAVAGTTYGYSGLRSEDSGSNFYNSLNATSTIDASIPTSDIALNGIAFTSQTTTNGGNPTVLQNLENFTQNASANGFIIVYAAQSIDTSAGPSLTPCTLPDGTSGGSHNFCQGKYYVYFQGRWDTPPGGLNTSILYDKSSLGLKIEPLSIAISQTKYRVTFYKPIGGPHQWSTYVYVMTKNLQDTSRNWVIPLNQ